ncbi:RluA family pseudouridine synthase [Paenibacillus sp. WLX2291]|uniref:RluA family pseudouridine synthase n=1 Tax=Paenibacillus sp. WLX2291 TaxID=3296934 RepID=UPI003984126D
MDDFLQHKRSTADHSGGMIDPLTSGAADHPVSAVARPEASRNGEWLDVTPGTELDLQQTEQRHRRMMEWLGHHFPVKLLGRLHSRGEIKVDGDMITLRLFPDSEYGFTPDHHHLPDVLFEDDYVLVVHKPAGVAVHPSDAQDQRRTLAGAVAAYFEHSHQHCAVRHVHRLDDDTTGPVLYAKNEFALMLLDEQMRDKDIGRRYVALVQGKVDRRLRVIDEPIGKDRHHKQRRRVSPGGQSAVTHVELIHAASSASLVRLTLETGRTHQIRVHMSDAGHPLVGDTLYGGKPGILSRQALHGEQLEFVHPWTGETIVVQDRWPDDFKQAAQKLGLLS